MEEGEGPNARRASSIDCSKCLSTVQTVASPPERGQAGGSSPPNVPTAVRAALITVMSNVTDAPRRSIAPVPNRKYPSEHKGAVRRALEPMVLVKTPGLFFLFSSLLWPGRPSALGSTAASLLFSPSPSFSPVSHAQNRLHECFTSCFV